MSNNRYKKLQKYFEPQYDSDTDLPEEDQEVIKEKMRPQDADEARQAAWENQGTYPKLKKAFKTAWYGDKRKKD